MRIDGRLAQLGLAVSVIAQWTIAPGETFAQAAKAKKEPAAEVEEITVTAQRREENIQETPVAVSAFTSNTVQEKGIENVIDIAPLTPNLKIRPNVGGNSGQTINMRGTITTDVMVFLEPTVGVYLDGVFIAKSAGSRFGMRDVERIEVLRGPQGTLYGRNTVGGAINIITRKPQGDKSVRAVVDLGSYNSFKGDLTVDLPVVGEDGPIKLDGLGTINVRSTFENRNRDGFFRNTGYGSAEFDNLNRIMTNQAVRWLPTESLTVDYVFDYTRARERTNSFQLSGLHPGAQATTILKPYLAVHRQDSIANNAVLMPNGKEQPLANHFDVRGHALTGALDLGEVGPMGEATLKSIAAYRSLGTLEVNDMDGSPKHIGDFGLNLNFKQFSEELQWLGSMPRVHYVAGFFYSWEEGVENADQVVYNASNVFQAETSYTAFSYAPFGQVTWTPPLLDDRLSLTGGLRYARDKKRARRDYDCIKRAGTTGGCTGRSFEAMSSRNFENVTPMGAVNYQWTDDLMTYVKVSRGFKSGGFNGRALLESQFVDPFESETLTAYEAGLKSDWLDKRLRVNLAGFFSDYEDLQVSVFRSAAGGGTGSSIENAADAEIKGLELEMQATPLRGLDLRLAYGWLDPEYKSFMEYDDTTGRFVDVKAQRYFAMSPEHSGSTTVTYTFEPADWGTLSASLDATWQDDIVMAAKDVEMTSQGNYALLHARMQLVDIPTDFGVFDVAAYGRNLTDRSYRVMGIDFGKPNPDPNKAGLGFAGNMYGSPRTAGVEVTWKWKGS